jgi:hypothetical protein
MINYNMIKYNQHKLKNFKNVELYILSCIRGIPVTDNTQLSMETGNIGEIRTRLHGTTTTGNLERR